MPRNSLVANFRGVPDSIAFWKFMTKYQDGSEFIALKSLVYFEDAESDPMPYMFEEISWEEIKSAIRTEVTNTL